jgi:hypothetical protein
MESQDESLERDPDALKDDRREAFCHRYIIDHNKTKAYMDVYPAASYNSARSGASRLLTKDDIKTRVAQLKAARAKERSIDHEYITNIITTALSIDLTQFMSLTAQEVKDLPLEVRMQVEGYKNHTKTYTGGDGKEITEERFELQFMGRKSLLEMLNKHTGFYEADNSQKAPSVVITKEEALEISKYLEDDV